MPSTYTTNTGIEKPGDGEQAGSWGDTANDNFDIIDRALNGVGSIALSGTTHTLTTSDGVLSDGQYRVLVLGGSPSGTNTITLSPNDAQHLYFVRNNSGQSAVFTQGSGGNVTVPNGRGAIIYANGAGSGAAVVDVSNLFVPNLTNAGVTSSVAELNILDGVTATTAELNILDGVTATTAEINILDGVTATTAEINILDGVTATANEINLVDGSVAGTIVNGKAVVYGPSGAVNATTLQIGGSSITASTTEINRLVGVTSAVQTQIDSKAPLTGSGASGQWNISAYPRRSDGTNISIQWSGQAGQPNWVVGSNDSVNFPVWNPANFSVNYANSAAYASTAGYASSAGFPSTAGAVGTYMFLGTGVSSQNLQAGATLAGSSLFTGGITFFDSSTNGYGTDGYYNVNGVGSGPTGQQSGTWRLMGRIRSDTSAVQAGGSVWLRIS